MNVDAAMELVLPFVTGTQSYHDNNNIDMHDLPPMDGPAYTLRIAEEGDVSKELCVNKFVAFLADGESTSSKGAIWIAQVLTIHQVEDGKSMMLQWYERSASNVSWENSTWRKSYTRHADNAVPVLNKELRDIDSSCILLFNFELAANGKLLKDTVAKLRQILSQACNE